MPPDLDLLWNLGSDVLAVLATEWPGDAEPLPERRFVASGEVAWDCAQVAVHVVRTFGIEADLTVEQITAQSASAGFAARAAAVEVTLLRCVADLDARGNAPSADRITSDAAVVLKDPTAVLNVLVAAHRAGNLGSCNGLAFETWQSVGPEGGIAGGVTRFRVALY